MATKRKYYYRKQGNKRVRVAMPKKHSSRPSSKRGLGRVRQLNVGNPMGLDRIPTLL